MLRVAQTPNLDPRPAVPMPTPTCPRSADEFNGNPGRRLKLAETRHHARGSAHRHRRERHPGVDGRPCYMKRPVRGLPQKSGRIHPSAPPAAKSGGTGGRATTGGAGFARRRLARCRRLRCRCDLRGADLRGADLRGADFRGLPPPLPADPNGGVAEAKAGRPSDRLLNWCTTSAVPPTASSTGHSTRPAAPITPSVKVAAEVEWLPLARPLRIPEKVPSTPPMTPVIAAPPTARRPPSLHLLFE